MSLETLLKILDNELDDDDRGGSSPDTIDILLGSGKRKADPECTPAPEASTQKKAKKISSEHTRISFDDDDDEDTLPMLESATPEESEDEEETTCVACKENQPNQEAHYGGCMRDPSADDDWISTLSESPLRQTVPERKEVTMVLQGGTSLDTLVKLHAVMSETGNREARQRIEDFASETEWSLEEFRSAFKIREFPLLETLLFVFFPLLHKEVMGESP